MCRTCSIVLFLVLPCLGFAPSAKAQSVDVRALQRHALDARLEPAQRDEHVQAMASLLAQSVRSDRDAVHEAQRVIQAAFMLVCDESVLTSLSPETVAQVDDALESVFTYEEVIEGDRWDPLAYVHGFFNHDVVPSDIARVRDGWAAIPEDERGRHYPTYIHAIDGVTKPLAYWELAGKDEMKAALETALPLLLEMLEQPPAPGTAFHPPSHAPLVLAPLFARWRDHPEYGPVIKRHLGSKEEFIQRLAGRLVGARDDRDTLASWEYTFHRVSGMYVANALARLGARSATPILRASLQVYLDHPGRGAAPEYTRRALVALGDPDARAYLEEAVEKQRLGHLAEEWAVWLCRNGDDKARTYGEGILRRILETDAADPLAVYFARERETL